MWKTIIKALKELYIKISCVMCCKSKCAVQVGREEGNNNNTDISNT